jgi:hypothetical protein
VQQWRIALQRPFQNKLNPPRGEVAGIDGKPVYVKAEQIRFVAADREVLLSPRL